MYPEFAEQFVKNLEVTYDLRDVSKIYPLNVVVLIDLIGVLTACTIKRLRNAQHLFLLVTSLQTEFRDLHLEEATSYLHTFYVW